MHMLSLPFPGTVRYLYKKSCTYLPFRRNGRFVLRMTISTRLALGFLLAALLGALTTGLIGIQHTEIFRNQSSFYLTLLRSNTNLNSGADTLRSIDLETTQALQSPALELQNHLSSVQTLMASYDTIIHTYASHDLLAQHPEQANLLADTLTHEQIDEQRTYTDGVLRTWDTYRAVQTLIIGTIQSGKVAQAGRIAHLQGETSNADATSSLRSLINFNEQLANAYNDAVNIEIGRQQLTAVLGALLAFLGIVAVGVVISHTLVRRLRRLHTVTQAVEQGQTNARVRVTGSDEIADVSMSVNTMLDSLVDSMQHTIAAKQQMDLAYEQQCQLNEMKDQFIQGVSHELRTPLTQVYGFLQLLRDHRADMDPARQAHFIDQATQGCEDMIELFNTILDASNAGRLAKSPTFIKRTVKELVEGVLEQCDPREAASRPITLAIPPSLAVKADLQYVRQVLLNLLTNAFKYTPPHSPISIQAVDYHEAGAPARVCIRVQDAGPGIPPEEQTLLFQQFARLKRDVAGKIRGTGLGLYICKQFVEAMHGHIWVESSGINGEGSCFCFTLPKA